MFAFYHIALFIHVTGVLALFIATSFELVSLARLRGAKTLEEAREAGKIAIVHVKLILPAVLTVFLAGMYMTIAAWSFTTAWIDVALTLFFLHTIAARAVSEPRAKAIFAALAKACAGPLSPALRAKVSDPVLNVVSEVMFAQTLSIVFLMTVKPELVVALVVATVATVIGLIPTLLRRRKAELTPTQNAAPKAERALSLASK